MCGETSNLFRQSAKIPLSSSLERILTNLVAKALGSDNSNFVADTLVGLEVEGELWVVALNDDLGGLLDGLCSYATHVCGCDMGID
jgi:hypothetical protein